MATNHLKTIRMDTIANDQHKAYKGLVETISDGLIISDMDHNIIYVNDQLCKMSGYGKEAIIGRKVYEVLIYQGNIEQIAHKIDETLNGIPVEYQVIHKNPKTGMNWRAQVNISPFRDAFGKIIGALGVIKDITQREKAENALAESEQRYRLLFDNAFDGIVIFDSKQNKPISCNKKILEYFGCSEEAFLSHSPIELSPEYQPNGLSSVEARDRLLKLYENKLPVKFEWTHKSLDGRIFDTELTTITLPAPSDHLRISIMQDITEQKKAERELSQSEKRFRSLFEQSPFGVAMNSQLNGKLIVNHRFCEMLGYEQEEFEKDLTLFDVTHPDDLHLHRDQFQKMMKGQFKSFTIQKRYIHKNGGTVWGHVTVTAIQEADGRVTNNFAMVEDITERKFTNEALEFISRQIATSNPKSFFKNVVKSLASTFNIPYVLIGEIDINSLEGKSQAFWMNGKFQDITYSIKNSPCEYAFKSKEVFCIENDVQDKYPLFDILANLKIKSYMTIPLLASKGIVIGHIALMSYEKLPNIDMIQRVLKIYSTRVASELERLQNDTAFKESAKKLQDAERITNMGNWEYDMQNQKLYLSEGLHRILKYTIDPQISIDKLIETYSHPEDLPMVKKAVNRAVKNRTPWNLEVRNIVNGKIIYTISKGRVSSKKGKAIKIFGTLQDISDKKEVEFNKNQLFKKVEQANKELKDFAYIVSHDLKAPLRAIGSLSQWLKEDYADKLDEQGNQHLDLLLNRVNRMHNFIEGILQYSRLGRIQIEPESVDINLLIRNVVDSLHPPVHIDLHIQKDLPIIKCEKIRIQQVFQNLISNAIKFNDKDKGKIRIAYKSMKGFHHFSVSDNGVGIEERYFEKIFQLFQTLQVRDHYESTGIGLTVVKRIVELHGGQISVNSIFGKGTTFEFTLKKE